MYLSMVAFASTKCRSRSPISTFCWIMSANNFSSYFNFSSKLRRTSISSKCVFCRRLDSRMISASLFAIFSRNPALSANAASFSDRKSSWTLCCDNNCDSNMVKDSACSSTCRCNSSLANFNSFTTFS